MKVGKNVRISDKASIYGAENIEIGDNVRIDDFCILSAGSKIVIGNNVHIACYSALIGKGEIVMMNGSGLSMGCLVISSSDDYSGNFLVNPTFPEELLNVEVKKIVIGELATVGARSTLLPGASLRKGAVLGAHSLLKKVVPEFEIWAGVPAKFIKKRNRKIEKWL